MWINTTPWGVSCNLALRKVILLPLMCNGHHTELGRRIDVLPEMPEAACMRRL